MKQIDRLMLPVAAVLFGLASVSCVEDLADQVDDVPVIEEQGDVVMHIGFNVPEYVFVDEKPTKAAMSASASFSWNTGDLVQVWPSKADLFDGSTPTPVKFKSTSDGSHSTMFDGNGWGLLRGTTYYAVFPYSSTSAYSSCSVKWTGQEQAADNSTAHLGAYSYLHSSMTIPSSGDIPFFNFDKVGCFVKFVFTLPAGVSSKYFTSLTLSSEEPLFLARASYAPANANVTLSNKVMTDLFTIKLNGSTGFRPTNNTLTVYAMMGPTAWNGKSFSVTLSASDGSESTVAVTPKSDLTPGSAKVFNITYNNFNSDCVNLSASGTANCYIVPSAGKYKFNAGVKGNSAESVGTPESVEVLWESFGTGTAPVVGDVVSKVFLSGKYVVFTSKATKGNAVIAVKDASGNILWSWHIWRTDAPGQQTLRNNAGTLMDRNLGALSSAVDNVLSYGLLYQWGRKDPFPGAATRGDDSSAACTHTWSYTSSSNTIEYSVLHPMVFISASRSSKADWDSSNSASKWSSTKTKYDPCPPGWRVPGRIWEVALNEDLDGSMWWSNYGMNVPVTVSGTAWLPAAGIRYDEEDVQCVGDRGRYWTNVGQGTTSGRIGFSDVSKHSAPRFNEYRKAAQRAIARSVRCVTASSPEPVPVTDLTINKSATQIREGNSESLLATVSPANATNKQVRWESSNTSVATVSVMGVVNAVSPGEAVVIGHLEGRSVSCNVTVVPATIPVTGISLNKTSVSVERDAHTSITATVTPSDATNKTVYWTSSNNDVATVSGGYVTALTPGIVTITARTQDGNKTATCQVTVNEYYLASTGYVDMGLSVRWAAKNLGAGGPEGTGGYYSWGEGASSIGNKANYSWTYYTLSAANSTWANPRLTKYNNDSSIGTVDNLTVLSTSDDVSWRIDGDNRIPSTDDFQQLITKCSWKWTTYKGVNGYLVTGSGGGRIFLPATGYKHETDNPGVGSNAYYWTRNLNTDDASRAMALDFYRDSYHQVGSGILRCYGANIRPVMNQ